MLSLAPDIAQYIPDLPPPTLVKPDGAHISTVLTQVSLLAYSVGVMAYNEEANIRRVLKAILEQKCEKTCLSEIIVVASGCTDNTIPIVQEYMRENPCIHLLIQKKREGRASAINLFLREARSPLLVLMGAHALPDTDTLEQLCTQFEDETVGMVGARPVPLNDQNTFIGHAVYLLKQLQDGIERRVPEPSEVVAFRNIVESIPPTTIADEISLQMTIAQQGLRMVYAPEAFVYNKAPMNIRDFLAQRRLIYCGYLQARAEGHFSGSRLETAVFLRVLLENAPEAISTPRQMCWTAGALVLEGLARLRGAYDVSHVPAQQTSKPVQLNRRAEDKNRRLRRIYNSQSVIVFKLSRVENEHDTFRKHEQRIRLRMARALVPLIRKNIRKNDLLSLHGNDTLVLLINADPSMVHSIALRIKHVMESQQIKLGNNRIALPRVRYHAVSFTWKPQG